MKKEFRVAFIVIVLALMICIFLFRRQYAEYRRYDRELLREFKKVNDGMKIDSSFRHRQDSLERRIDSLKRLLDSASRQGN